MTNKNNPHIEIDVAIPEQKWESALPALESLAQDTVAKALSMADIPADATEISIVFGNDSFIQDLNARYRDKNKPTNVLSFPQDDGAALGDVILALETIQNEAEEQGKPFEDHVRHLIVHGTLHLLGHDHEDEEDAETMEALEIQILQELGIKNPYEVNDSVR